MSNDRLKFRAWDKENETMVYAGDGDPYVFCIFEDSSLELRTFFDEAGYVPVDSEFMQWTGLYDKDGTNIYLGDIVEYREDDEYGLAIVDYINRSTNMAFFWQKQTTPKPSLFDEVHYFGYSPALKVLGNIHENPELMERANG